MMTNAKIMRYAGPLVVGLDVKIPTAVTNVLVMMVIIITSQAHVQILINVLQMQLVFVPGVRYATTPLVATFVFALLTKN